MTDTQSSTLVLKDAAGSYFLVPQETLEQGRVPAEQTAELERQMAEDAEDVQGYVVVFFVVGLLSIVGGLVLVDKGQGHPTASIPKGEREFGNKI